jgi:hypothetical protein
VLQADLAAAGRAANGSTNVALAGAIQSLRERVTIYLGALNQIGAGIASNDPVTHVAALQELKFVAQPAHDAETTARHECAVVGIAVRPSNLLGGGPAP